MIKGLKSLTPTGSIEPNNPNSKNENTSPSFIKWTQTSQAFPIQEQCCLKPQIYTDENNEEWVIFLVDTRKFELEILHWDPSCYVPLSGCLYSLKDKKYIIFGNPWSSHGRLAYFSNYIIDSANDTLYIWVHEHKMIVKIKMVLTFENVSNSKRDQFIKKHVTFVLIERVSLKKQWNFYQSQQLKTKLNESNLDNYRGYLPFGNQCHMLFIEHCKQIHILGGGFRGQHYIFDITTNKFIKFDDNICHIKSQLLSKSKSKSNTGDRYLDKKCASFEIGSIIDAKDAILYQSLEGNFYLAKIVDIKAKGESITKDFKLLKHMKKGSIHKSMKRKYTKLKGILIHYIGWENKWDDWIYINENETFCNCINKCAIGNHRIAPANTQSKIAAHLKFSQDRYDYNPYNNLKNRDLIIDPPQVAVFHSKKLHTMIAFGQDPIKDSGKGNVFDTSMYYRFTNRLYQFGVLIEGYGKCYYKSTRIPKVICDLICKHIFDESCYDLHVSEWRISDISIRTTINLRQFKIANFKFNYNSNVKSSTKYFKLQGNINPKISCINSSMKMNSKGKRESLTGININSMHMSGIKVQALTTAEKVLKRINSSLTKNNNDTCKDGCNGDKQMIDSTSGGDSLNNCNLLSNFDFVVVDDAYVSQLFVFDHCNGIFKLDYGNGKNILEKISDYTIDYDYVVYSKQKRQIHFFVQKEFSAKDRRTRHKYIDLQDLLVMRYSI